jgi:TldD protein
MEFYDIRQVESESLTLQIENGVLEKPKYDYSKVKGFRVLKNGFWGFFEGNVDDKKGIEIAEKNAVFEGESDVLEVSMEGKFILKPKKSPLDVPIEEKIQLLRDIEKILSDIAVNTKISYFENVRKFSYTDSCGSEVFYEVPRIGISVFAVAKGKTLQFYSKRHYKAGGYEKLKGVTDLAYEVKDVLSKLVDASPPPSGKMNVVMDPSLAGVFVHEAFGHAVEADHVLQGATILSNRIGDRVADECVTICDNPLIEEFGFYPFDDEGVKAEKTVIVEKGVLKSFLHSRETAKKLNGKPGNARAQGVEIPIVRMSNTYLETGDRSFDELVEECKNGIYLIGSRGGETNPATGYFHFNAQYGYVVRDGEIAEMVRDVSLSGNTLEVLKEVKLGKEQSFDPGFCGKAMQLVPVSDGAPHVLCRAVVGGE